MINMKIKLVIFFVVLMMYTPGCFSSSVEDPESIFHGDLIVPAKQVIDFNLLSSDNETYNFKNNTNGKITVIAFLFTNCYDICPIVTYNLRAIHETLNQSQLDLLEFITITVDPWRDNTTVMNNWKESTKSNWTHLTVQDTSSTSQEMKTLNSVWSNFDVGFKVEENTTQSNTSGRHHPSALEYNIDHSTGTVLIDSNGNQRIWWGDYDWIVDLVKEDILNLLEELDN